MRRPCSHFSLSYPLDTSRRGIWLCWVLCFCYAFILPYQIGVSGSIALVFNIPWLVFNIFLNSIFFVDTFLYFFRAYYTPNGHLVLDLKKIRRHYLLTLFVPNLLSVLPYTLFFYIVGTKYLDSLALLVMQFSSSPLFSFASLLKLIRLVRAKSILARSDVVTNFRQKRNSQVLELWKYVWLIVIVSHWFACIWSFVAILEADGLSAEKLTSTPNWIGGWYADNATDGGLNPLGWDTFYRSIYFVALLGDSDHYEHWLRKHCSSYAGRVLYSLLDFS